LFQVAIKSSIADIVTSRSHTELRQQHFHLIGSGTRLNLILHSSSTSLDSSGSLVPIIGASYNVNAACDIENCNSEMLWGVRRVDVYSSPHGVTGVTFIGYHDASTTTYGDLVGSCSSFLLRDVGLSNTNLISERIVEILVMQDNQKVHSLQVLTDRGRMSACPLPSAEWQEHKVSSPWRFSRTVRDQLQLCLQQPPSQLPHHHETHAIAHWQPEASGVAETEQLPVLESQNVFFSLLHVSVVSVRRIPTF
jgi:hypothetical protein